VYSDLNDSITSQETTPSKR